MTDKALVEKLLDAAFRELQHDTGLSDPEYVHQRRVLRDEFNRILRNDKARRYASTRAAALRGRE